MKKTLTSIVGEKIETILHPKNNYFKKHAMKGKNARERNFGNEKKKILVIKTKKNLFLSLDDKDQKNVLNVRQIKV